MQLLCEIFDLAGGTSTEGYVQLPSFFMLPESLSCCYFAFVCLQMMLSSVQLEMQEACVLSLPVQKAKEQRFVLGELGVIAMWVLHVSQRK